MHCMTRISQQECRGILEQMKEQQERRGKMDKQLPVSVWPEWKIIEKIGEGSFGKVYKATRTEQCSL